MFLLLLGRRMTNVRADFFCGLLDLFGICKSGKQHKTCSSALCTMDDASYFLVIRLEPKTSECEKNVTVVSTVTGCDLTNCATTIHGFNKHASSRREAVSDLRGVPRCAEKISKNLRLLTCVDRASHPIHHTFCLQLVFVTRRHCTTCQVISSQSAVPTTSIDLSQSVESFTSQRCRPDITRIHISLD